MSRHLQKDLDAVEREILAQSSLVEEMTRKACRALRESQPVLAQEVLQAERHVDEREVMIEDECLKILALHQPVAIDLRRTATILKINSDLERIGDLAVNIAERSQSLAAHPGFPIPDRLDRMSHCALAMVRSALDAFVNMDVKAAQDVCAADDEVDELNRELIDKLCETMRARSDLIEAALHFFSASRHVERIADHATNIAEDVIYLVEGEIARHKHE